MKPLVEVAPTVLTRRRYFDTPCCYGRDLAVLKTLVDGWYGGKLIQNASHVSRPSTSWNQVGADVLTLVQSPQRIIFLSESSPQDNIPQAQILERFVTDMASCLNITAETISMEELWSSQSPAETQGASMREYMNEDVRTLYINSIITSHRYLELSSDCHKILRLRLLAEY